MHYLSRNPRRVLVGLLTVIVAAAAAVGSGADFSSHSANPTNTFASGTLLQSNSRNGVAIVTGSNLKPGDVRTGEVTITNTGSLAGTFKLSESNATNPFGGGDMTMKIDDVTGQKTTNLYSGDIGKAPAEGINLGNFAAGEARTYRFTATFNKEAPNSDQGKVAKADYEWDAVPTP
jgi:spore coat-associated protein N